MGWITAPAQVHTCALPPASQLGLEWQCDDCKQRWKTYDDAWLMQTAWRKARL